MSGSKSPAWQYLNAPKEDQDAAKRMSDSVTLHLLADPVGNVGRWCAFALSDGRSDGVAYDSASPPADPRAHAIRHQLHESLYCYLCIQPNGLTPEDALIFLKFNRSLYDAGMRMTEPPPPRPGGLGRQIIRNRFDN